MRYLNLPVWIGALSRPTKPAFSALFTLEPLARSTIVTVIPLMALDRLGTAQNVSIFFFLARISWRLHEFGGAMVGQQNTQARIF